MKPPQIAIGVSSVWENRDRLALFFENNRDILATFFEVILVLQNSPVQVPEVDHGLRNCRIINSSSRGLSASRNTAIDACTAEYLWFLDDDVVLARGCCDTIKHALTMRPECQAFTFEFAFLEDHCLAKKYPKRNLLKKLDLLRVSSIEIIVSVQFIRSSRILFDPNFGLGSGKFPAGEENMFLLDCHDHGARVAHIQEVIVMHPRGQRSIDILWRKPGRLQGMGIVARRFKLLGFALAVRWAIRGLTNGLSLSDVSQIFRGLFFPRPDAARK